MRQVRSIRTKDIEMINLYIDECNSLVRLVKDDKSVTLTLSEMRLIHITFKMLENGKDNIRSEKRPLPQRRTT